jgi:predicted nucleic acid-binding protein
VIYLLDTNAVTDAMNEHPTLQARAAASSASDRVTVCSIVRGEILYGIERLAPGRRRSELERKAAAVLASLACEAVPAAAGDEYARVKVAQQRLGLVIDEHDLWIAATTLAIGAALVTRDRDFSRIPGLTVEDWTI